ncbi:AAA family ATPase [Klebsiella pneumoniae]
MINISTKNVPETIKKWANGAVFVVHLNDDGTISHKEPHFIDEPPRDEHGAEQRCSVSDPSTLRLVGTILDTVERRNALLKGSEPWRFAPACVPPYSTTIIDLDNKKKPGTKAFNAINQHIDKIKQLAMDIGLYCELSISGNGLHIFAPSTFPLSGVYKHSDGLHVDFLNSKRFVILSGCGMGSADRLTHQPTPEQLQQLADEITSGNPTHEAHKPEATADDVQLLPREKAPIKTAADLYAALTPCERMIAEGGTAAAPHTQEFKHVNDTSLLLSRVLFSAFKQCYCLPVVAELVATYPGFKQEHQSESRKKMNPTSYDAWVRHHLPRSVLREMAKKGLTHYVEVKGLAQQMQEIEAQMEANKQRVIALANRVKRFDPKAPGAPAPYIIEDVFPVGVTVIFGAPGSLKTFVCVHVLGLIAVGSMYFGIKRVKGGLAVFVMAEAPDTIPPRFAAWNEKHNGGNDLSRLFLIEDSPDFCQRKNLDELAANLREIEKETGEKIRAVCIDTLTDTYSGNQNDISEMATYITGFKQVIAKPFQCSVIITHHEGKDKSKGPRGASTIEGSADAMYACSCEEDHTGKPLSVTLTGKKDKSGRKKVFTFPVDVVPLPENYLPPDDEDEYTTIKDPAIEALRGDTKADNRFTIVLQAMNLEAIPQGVNTGDPVTIAINKAGVGDKPLTNIADIILTYLKQAGFKQMVTAEDMRSGLADFIYNQNQGKGASLVNDEKLLIKRLKSLAEVGRLERFEGGDSLLYGLPGTPIRKANK